MFKLATGLAKSSCCQIVQQTINFNLLHSSNSKPKGLFLPCFEANACIYEQFRSFKKLMEFMPRIHKILRASLLASAVGLSLLVTTPAFAQTSAAEPLTGEDKTVATVNGYEIKTSEVRMAFDDVIGQLPNMPPKLRFPFVVEFLIERHLLAQVAAKDGVGESDDYKRRLAAYQAKALRDSYLAQKISPSVTDDEIKAAYDKESAKVKQTERVRARHILVATEKEATDIEAKLKNGDKFEDLAKQYSLDGSKDYGGDLGYFTAPEMVKEFSDAAFKLKVGEVSPPVKTDYGWHVIRMDDRKMGAAQPFDQVKSAIRNVLVRDKVQALLASLQGTAKVEILDPDLKKAQADADAQHKLLLEKQKGDAGAAVAGEQPPGTDDSGKGDLALPDAPQQ
jgi:peptidyl-prolyl cis-trans isomerase C